MASNSFGQIFRITTFGESHGPAIGVVIDGCPAGLSISKEEIDDVLFFRKSARSSYVSQRKETDSVEILSGIFEGRTTGAPIALLIRNIDADSSQYESIQDLYRPGHANFTYLEKYGIFDGRGGGRASARETAARVAAGAVAKKLLKTAGISCAAFLSQIGDLVLSDLPDVQKKTASNPFFCPDETLIPRIEELLQTIRQERDSIGGVVSCIADIPPGLGDPIYCKLGASLAFAMLSIPASKGFEIGTGFASARMKGSEHNDAFELDAQGRVRTATNCAGGILGGISNGSPLYFRVAFKPTSSILQPQQTVSVQGEIKTLQWPLSARHDLCVAIRAVPVVEAMAAIVLADAVLMNQTSVISSLQKVQQ